MRSPLRPRSRRLLPIVLLLPFAAAVSFDCHNVVTGDHSFDFSPLGGEHTISHVTKFPPNIRNTTYSINICAQLDRDPAIDAEKQCPKGTWVCGITTLLLEDHSDIEHVLPIARQYEHDGASLDPKLQILPNSNSNADSEKSGVRVRMGGGTGTSENGKVRQQAVIEFLCPEAKPASVEAFHHVAQGAGNKRDDDKDEDEKPNPEWEKMKSTDDGHGGTLTFMSYNQDDNEGTLHLEWKTKYACRDYDGSDGDGGTQSGSGWGFFSWLFFLGFLGLVGYFGFFAWINYNKYGATGWDLVPHADAIRDLPYVLSDWGQKVIGSVTGGPSRGGYSAV